MRNLDTVCVILTPHCLDQRRVKPRLSFCNGVLPVMHLAFAEDRRDTDFPLSASPVLSTGRICDRRSPEGLSSSGMCRIFRRSDPDTRANLATAAKWPSMGRRHRSAVRKYTKGYDDHKICQYHPTAKSTAHEPFLGFRITFCPR